jgi:hypothetical protein
VRRKTTTIGKVIPDFIRNEADGPAQFDKGQALLAKFGDGLDADMKKLSHHFGSPKVLEVLRVNIDWVTFGRQLAGRFR